MMVIMMKMIDDGDYDEDAGDYDEDDGDYDGD